MNKKCRIKGCENEPDTADFCKIHFAELNSIYMEDDRSVVDWLVAGKEKTRMKYGDES